MSRPTRGRWDTAAQYTARWRRQAVEHGRGWVAWQVLQPIRSTGRFVVEDYCLTEQELEELQELKEQEQEQERRQYVQDRRLWRQLLERRDAPLGPLKTLRSRGFRIAAEDDCLRIRHPEKPGIVFRTDFRTPKTALFEGVSKTFGADSLARRQHGDRYVYELRPYRPQEPSPATGAFGG